MIGMVRVTSEIPAGALVYYDSERNTLVVFNDVTGQVHAYAQPFVAESVEHDRTGRLQ